MQKVDRGEKTLVYQSYPKRVKRLILQGFFKRMIGLEPTTFCMARTWRETTGADWNRHVTCLCGFWAAVSVSR
jgi:hypothetical protein